MTASILQWKFGITAVCATPSFWKDLGRDCVRIRFVADVFRPPTLSAGISDICEKRLNTELMPPPPKNWLIIGENGEIKSDKEPMSPPRLPEEMIISLTYWEISEMMSDT